MTVATSFPPNHQDRTTEAGNRLPISSRVFYGILMLGMVVRIASVFSAVNVLDSDHAVVYLMAKHFSQGQFTIFFWGQSYGGTVLPATAGAAMFVFGQHVEVLQVVSAIIFAGVTLVVRAISAQAFGQFSGDVAGVIFWFPGAFLLTLSLSDPGFYGPTLLFGLLTIWLSLTVGHGGSYLRWGLIGLCAGIALWQSPIGAALAMPAVIWLLRRGSWRHYATGLAGAAVGASPWLFAALTDGLSVIRPKGSGNVNFHSFVTLFTRLVPYALEPRPGAIIPTIPHFLSKIGAVSALFLLILLIILAIRRPNRWIIVLAISSVLTIVILVRGAGVLLAADSARYTVFLLPYISIALAWLFSRVRPVGYLAIGLIPIVTLCLLVPRSGYFTKNTDQRYMQGISQVEVYLLKNKVRAAYGDYWLAYRMSAATEERVTIAALAPRRYEPYEKMANGRMPMAIVVYAGQRSDRILVRTVALPNHVRHVISGYAVFVFDRWFNPYQPGRFPWDSSAA